jgi:hypothetical protein
VLSSGPGTNDSQVPIENDEELEALLQDMDPDMRRLDLERLATSEIVGDQTRSEYKDHC